MGCKCKHGDIVKDHYHVRAIIDDVEYKKLYKQSQDNNDLKNASILNYNEKINQVKCDSIILV